MSKPESEVFREAVAFSGRSACLQKLLLEVLAFRPVAVEDVVTEHQL